MDVVQQAAPEASAAAGPAEPPAEESSREPSVQGPVKRHTSESQVCRSVLLSSASKICWVSAAHQKLRCPQPHVKTCLAPEMNAE